MKLKILFIIILLFSIVGISIFLYINSYSCPKNCDNNSICTEGVCSKETNYKCQYYFIENCCGNNKCETEEDNNCLIDCPHIFKDFSYPYIVSWVESYDGYSISYDLTKIRVGKKVLDINPYASEFKKEDVIDALTLYFKIIKIGKTGSGVCPIIDFRIVSNKEGDLAGPLNTSFNANCFWDNQTYYNQEAIFSIPKGQKQFIILTQNEPSLKLTITILDDGEIKIEKALIINQNKEYSK